MLFVFELKTVWKEKIWRPPPFLLRLECTAYLSGRVEGFFASMGFFLFQGWSGILTRNFTKYKINPNLMEFISLLLFMFLRLWKKFQKYKNKKNI